jgi:hypothetical protein
MHIVYRKSSETAKKPGECGRIIIYNISYTSAANIKVPGNP